MGTSKESTYYIENRGTGADIKLGTTLLHLLNSFDRDFADLIILCIGSDRITGDSLGPLVGHSLEKSRLSNTHIYGTLSRPVHALNLKETVEILKNQYPHSLTLAVDASLGAKNHLGFLTISKGSLKPGLGVHKKLTPVGDISITGIVNTAGPFDHLNLQTTRLSTVVQMADSIVSGILMAHRQYFGTLRFPALPYFQSEEERTLNFAKLTSLSAAAASFPKGST